MRPYLSVLMSVYNGEKYLGEAVDSILAQTMADFEFIVVDDGSRDKTAEILASYRDPRLKIFTICNVGLAAALNYGLERCAADLVMRMDADDVCYPHRFAALLEDWEQAGKPDVFGSGADYINEEGKDLWSIGMPLDHATIQAALLAPRNTMVIMHPTVLLRKGAVLSSGAYDPYFSHNQDYDLWLRMTTHCRFGNSPRRLLRYRFQPGSDTARVVNAVDGQLRSGNWMRLLSLQKKLLIDAGAEEIWNAHRGEIIGALQRRADLRTLKAEAATLRFLTEAKVLYYGGNKRKGTLNLINLLFRHPRVVIKRITGRQMTDISTYLLSPIAVDRLLREATHG